MAINELQYRVQNCVSVESRSSERCQVPGGRGQELGLPIDDGRLLITDGRLKIDVR